MASNEKEPCPLCGSLPGDWVDDPHKNLVALRNVDQEPLVDHLFMALAELRNVSGVGEAPMMSELPDAISARFRSARVIISALRDLSSDPNRVIFGKGRDEWQRKANDWLLDE